MGDVIYLKLGFYIRCFLCWLIWAAVAPAWAIENSLSVSTDLSAEGYFVLSWQVAVAGQNIQLQQSQSADFDSLRYWPVTQQGQLTVTGLADGDYFYRLVSDSNAVIGPVKVTVQHHSLAQAGQFFALGFLLFAVLIVTIVIGGRRLREQAND